jgi:signal transduction histidine kinase
MIGMLRSVALEEHGLPAALEEQSARLQETNGVVPPAIALDLDPRGRDLPRPPARILLRVAQEATRNALRHGGANQLAIRLKVEQDSVTLSVQDDGRGATIPPQLNLLVRHGHFGLAGLEEEVLLARGDFTVESQPGVGTTVSARLPLSGPWGEDESGR